MDFIGLGVFTLLLIGYQYYVFVTGSICEGKVKNVVYLFLAFLLLGLSYYFHQLPFGVTLISLETVLFVYFYTNNRFSESWWKMLLPGIFILLCSLGFAWESNFNPVVVIILYFFFLYLLLSARRGKLRLSNLLIVLLIYGVLQWMELALARYSNNLNISEEVAAGSKVVIVLLALLVFLLLEFVLRSYELNYQKANRDLQEELLQRQFGEISDIYLNMRGWRHDYHNHIQALKANLDNGQVLKAREYLNQIEHELDKVDTFVKSGNMMVDAILNSKLTLAMKQNIKINCDAYLPQELFITDIDLCTILGNVLDNALESCGKIPETKRFIRIYIAMVKEQFYLSVQNGSDEILGFEQQNFITTKKGNHGLGMKRVVAVVDRWGGYLNLNQETGVFATEITIPKP